MQKSRNFKKVSFRMLAMLLTLVMVIGAIPASAKAQKRTEVGTKKKLLAEMKADSKQETIVFATEKEVSFTIGRSASNKNKKLVIDAPNATIVNKAKFKGVTIYNVKSYAEVADDNTIYVKDEDADIIVAKKANVKKIVFDTKNVDLELRKNSSVGKIVFREKNTKATVNVGENAGADITLSKKTSISVIGSENSDINIDADAKGSTVFAHVPVDIEVEKSVKVVLKEGSEGTVIEKNSDEATVKIVNQSSETPTIKENGEVVATPAPTNEPTPTPTAKPTAIPTPTATPVPTQSSDSGSGYSGGSSSYTPPTSTPTPTPTPTAAPTSAPGAYGTWYAYSSSNDAAARFDIGEVDNAGRRIKNGEFYTGYDMGWCDYYFYGADGRLEKALSADGSYVEYEYGDGTTFTVRRTSKNIDDIVTRVETDAKEGEGNNYKTTVTDGKGNLICYYHVIYQDKMISERIYEDPNGNKLTTHKYLIAGNRSYTVFSSSINERKGQYTHTSEYVYDEDNVRKTKYKSTSYNNGNPSYVSVTEYEYYDNGRTKKETYKDGKDNIRSSTSYEYDDNGSWTKITYRGTNDVLESYDVFVYEEAKHTRKHYDNKDVLRSYEVTEYVENGYTSTSYDGEDNVLGYVVYESIDDGKTNKFTFKDADAKVTSVETTTYDDDDRIIKNSLVDGEGKVLQSFECEYKDDEHSFSATYVENGKTTTLAAGYDFTTDIMTVNYKDGEKDADTIVKEFSKTGMQMRITKNGEVAFDRNSNKKIIKETILSDKWDNDKQTYVPCEYVTTYVYDETTGKLVKKTRTESGKALETTDYTYDSNGFLASEVITYNVEGKEIDDYTLASTEIGYYADDEISPTVKSRIYKYASGRTGKNEYNEKGDTLLVEYRDKEDKLSYKYTYAHNYADNVKTTTFYNAPEGTVSSYTEYTYKDGHYNEYSFEIKIVEKNAEGKVIASTEKEIDDNGNVLREVRRNADNAIISDKIYTYYEDGVKKSYTSKNADGKVTYEETYNEFGQTLTTKFYRTDGSISEEEVYTYDEDGEPLGRVDKTDGYTYEYKYFAAIRDYLFIKEINSSDVVVNEYDVEDLDGVLTYKMKMADGSLALSRAYYATNTTTDYYVKYDRTYYVYDQAASASAMKFELKKNDGQLTEIVGTYDGVSEFLNVKYYYDGNKNIKTIIKMGDNEYEYDQNGYRVYKDE